jgi:U3 small nucleolar RNA-associated protein 22
MKQIVEYILKRHLSLTSDDIVQLVDQLDFSLNYGGKDPISLSGNLVQAYEVLSKCLREIEGIPLKVSSVQSLDSGLLKFRNYKSVLALIFSVSVVSYFKFSS